MRYFEWQRPVPAPWQQELERLGGAPNLRVPWLLLDWEPGEVHREPVTGRVQWDPVQRFLIYEMIPPARLLAQSGVPRLSGLELLTALAGPPPRTLRYWWRCRAVVRGSDGKHHFSEYWDRRSRASVTQRQWELWRTWHCFARPFWVLQGAAGGHKHRLSPLEQRLVQAIGQRFTWPAPGDWSYAPWDGRVFAQLAEQQRLLEAQCVMRDLEARTDAHHRAERAMLGKAVQARLLQWLDAQQRAAIDEIATSRLDLDDAPRGAEITDDQLERAEARFLDAGV